MLTNETATLEEVAAELGRTPDWLMRHWLSYHQRTGFPRRVPGTWVWPRRAVEAFLRAGGVVAPQQPDNDNAGAVDLVAAASAALSLRYGVSS
ncbi:MAG: hypothetical protein KIS96_14585 [Bauldia sp.]|nr:hypothetical protein [Bauldia sp.]